MKNTAAQVLLLCGHFWEEYENVHPLITKHTGATYMDANPHKDEYNFFHNAFVYNMTFVLH